jgi:hypothetical protein
MTYRGAVSQAAIEALADALDMLEDVILFQNADLVARQHLHAEYCRSMVFCEAEENGVEITANFGAWVWDQVQKIRRMQRAI